MCCPDFVPPTNAPITTTQKPKGSIEPQIPTKTNFNSLRQHLRYDLVNRANCGSGSINRILHGEKAKIEDFPWMALLGYKNVFKEVSWECGGSLISGRIL